MSEWTKVEKDPPAEGVYLITDGKFTPVEGYWSQNNGWAVDRDARNAGFREITHWMPFPELPQARWDDRTHADWGRVRLLANDVTIDACAIGPPVEYMGACDDHYYYFRALQFYWRIAIADEPHVAAIAESTMDRGVVFYAEGRYGDERYGLLPLEQAEGIIRQCVRVWRLSRQDDV